MKTLPALLAAVALVACSPTPPPSSSPQGQNVTPKRVVTLAPSITETVFALGLGDRVVGSTPFCIHPPEAKALPKVGTLLDVNYEAILALQPDLVIVTSYHDESVRNLERLKLEVLQVDHRRLGGVMDSLEQLAQALGAPDAAAELQARMQGELDEVQATVQGRPRPTVLVTWGAGPMLSDKQEIYATGRASFHSEMLELAGGVNALDGEGKENVVLTREGLIRLDPDVILDLFADDGTTSADKAEEVRGSWSSLTELKAVRNGRVHVIAGDYVMMPGPRLTQTVRAMAQAIHPEADWGSR